MVFQWPQCHSYCICPILLNTSADATGSSTLCLIVRASLPEKEEPADTSKKVEEFFALLKVKVGFKEEICCEC
jgi:hypothetical protein